MAAHTVTITDAVGAIDSTYTEADLFFTLQYATRNVGVGWNAYTDYTTRMMGFNVTRGVEDWYRGPFAASGSVTLDDTDGAHPCPPGGKLQLSVTTASRTVYVIFEGVVAEQTYRLDAGRFPTSVSFVTDWYGFEAQRTYTPSRALSDATGTLLSTIIDDYSWGQRDTGDWDTTGVNQYVEAEDRNVPDLLSTLARGDMGLLFINREGKWVYRSQGWWNDDRASAVAALGDSSPTDPYTYLMPLKSTTPTNTVYEIINKATWTTPFATNESETTTDATSVSIYQERLYDDASLVTAATEAESATARLTRLYSGLEDRIAGITFPADLSVAAQEYAGQAEIGQFINVAMESLVGYWVEWVRCHVMAVTHDWSPNSGWTTTLGVTTGLWEDWDPWTLDTSALGTETLPL